MNANRYRALLAASLLAIASTALSQEDLGRRIYLHGAPDALPPGAYAGVPLAASYATAVEGAQLGPAGGPPAERGLFQGIDLTFDTAPRFGSDSLGRTNTSAAVKFGFPTPLGPLLVTPRYGLHLLDGPAGPDAPATLHDLELGFATFRQLNDRWSARGVVNVGLYGDDDSLGDADALRVSGFAMALYEASPAWQWAIGAAYINNENFSVLPVVGVIHDRGWVKYELMLPRPRIVWPVAPGPGGGEAAWYVAGELGGGQWAVRRTTGATDTLNLSRFGLLLGYETKPPLGGAWRYEIGYLFGRDLSYSDSGEELSLDDSLVARVGWSY